jgi:hypothetical protein
MIEFGLSAIALAAVDDLACRGDLSRHSMLKTTAEVAQQTKTGDLVL